MRWFCVAFGTLVVVSTALSHAGSPVSEGSADIAGSSASSVPTLAGAGLTFDVAEASRLNQNGAWSATILLGLPFLIRRRRERLG
jgi:hypothetical protein